MFVAVVKFEMILQVKTGPSPRSNNTGTHGPAFWESHFLYNFTRKIGIWPQNYFNTSGSRNTRGEIKGLKYRKTAILTIFILLLVTKQYFS